MYNLTLQTVEDEDCSEGYLLLVVALSTNDHREGFVDVAIQEVNSLLHAFCSRCSIRLWSCAVGKVSLEGDMVVGWQL